MPKKALSEQRELLALIDEAKFGEAKLVFGDVVFTSMHILHLRYRLVDCCFNLGDIQRISLKKSAWSNEKCEYFTLYLDDEFKMPYELTIQTKHADDLQRFLLEYTEKYKKVAGSRTVSEVMADNKEVIAAFEAKKPEEAKWIEELSKLHHDEEIKNHAVEHHLIDEKWKINPDIASNHPFYYYMVIINYANCAHYKNCPNNIFSKKKDAPPFGELENYFEHYRKVLLECGLLTNENNTYSWKNKVDRSKARYYIDERLITELKKQYNSLKDWYERTQEVYDYRKKKEKDFATGKAIKMAQKTTNVEVVSTPTSDTMKKPVKSVPVDKIQKCEPIVKASTAKEIVVTESKPKKLDQVRASIPASKKETNVPEIKAKKNQTGLMSILFGIVTWILLFSMIGIMLSFITAIIGIVFGIKGLFSKPKGKAIIGLIINALYVIFIIILVC